MKDNFEIPPIVYLHNKPSGVANQKQLLDKNHNENFNFTSAKRS